jgi:DNA replication licensing factor MCM5
MSGFDANNVYTVSVHDTPSGTSPESPSETEKLLLEFLLQYRVGGEFIYRSVPGLLPSAILLLNRLKRSITRESSSQAIFA